MDNWSSSPIWKLTIGALDDPLRCDVTLAGVVMGIAGNDWRIDLAGALTLAAAAALVLTVARAEMLYALSGPLFASLCRDRRRPPAILVVLVAAPPALLAANLLGFPAPRIGLLYALWATLINACAFGAYAFDKFAAERNEGLPGRTSMNGLPTIAASCS